MAEGKSELDAVVDAVGGSNPVVINPSGNNLSQDEMIDIHGSMYQIITKRRNGTYKSYNQESFMDKIKKECEDMQDVPEASFNEYVELVLSVWETHYFTTFLENGEFVLNKPGLMAPPVVF